MDNQRSPKKTQATSRYFLNHAKKAKDSHQKPGVVGSPSGEQVPLHHPEAQLPEEGGFVARPLVLPPHSLRLSKAGAWPPGNFTRSCRKKESSRGADLL